MSSLRVAFAFLTRIPVGARVEDGSDIGRAVPWFPLVGAFVGLVTALTYMAGSALWPNSVAAVIAVGVATWLTGAFHEDGLADTADAFGGSFTRERALEIFKDPRHGSFGVLALVLSVALRIALIAALDPAEAMFILPVTHAVSRGGALQLFAFLRPAAPGLGASYAETVARGHLLGAAVVACVIAAIGAGLLFWVPVVASLPAVVLAGWLSARKIGGLTGDVLGAAQQGAELSVLLVAVALERTGIVWAWFI